MIGLDFPIKPEWVHDIHGLWQPEQPVSKLVQTSLNQTMQELGGEKTRRNSLSIILRNFVNMDGRGRHRQTAAQDIWVSFSRTYPVSAMAPAYLVQIIAQNEVAQEATKFLTRRFEPGSDLDSNGLKQHIIARFGERKVVTNSASAFLRTLQYHGVLQAGKKMGAYQYYDRLSVPKEVFPLIIWTLWRALSAPQFDLDVINEHPALAFLKTDHFTEYWKAYQPELWVLSERLGLRQATLKATSDEEWQTALKRSLER